MIKALVLGQLELEAPQLLLVVVMLELELAPQLVVVLVEVLELGFDMLHPLVLLAPRVQQSSKGIIKS